MEISLSAFILLSLLSSSISAVAVDYDGTPQISPGTSGGGSERHLSWTGREKRDADPGRDDGMVSGQVMVDLARSLSAGLRRNMAGQQAFLMAARRNMSALREEVSSLGERIDSCCREDGGRAGIGEAMDDVKDRLSSLEDRRSLDEAVWVFNTVVCNASIEILRSEVAALAEEVGRQQHRQQQQQQKRQMDVQDDATTATSERPISLEVEEEDSQEEIDGVVSAPLGGSVRLECGVEGANADDSSVVWKRRTSDAAFFELLYINSFVFSPELSGRSAISDSDSSLNLTGLVESDSGVYLCDVSFSGEGGGESLGDRTQRKQVLLVADVTEVTTSTTTTTTLPTMTTTTSPKTEKLTKPGSGIEDDARLSRVEERLDKLEALNEQERPDKVTENEQSNKTIDATDDAEDTAADEQDEDLASLWSAVTELRRWRSQQQERTKVIEERMNALEALFFDAAAADIAGPPPPPPSDSAAPEVISKLESAVARLQQRIDTLEGKEGATDGGAKSDEDFSDDNDGGGELLSDLEKALLKMDDASDYGDEEDEDYYKDDQEDDDGGPERLRMAEYEEFPASDDDDEVGSGSTSSSSSPSSSPRPLLTETRLPRPRGSASIDRANNSDCRARSDPSSSPPPLPGQDEWCRNNCRKDKNKGGRNGRHCPENLCWCPP